MTPHYVAILEHEFSAHLLDISTLQRPSAAFHALIYRLHHCGEQATLDVVWLLAPEIKRPCHAKDVVELASRVGIGGEGALGYRGIHVDEFGTTAADDGDEGRGWKGEERLGGY